MLDNLVEVVFHLFQPRHPYEDGADWVFPVRAIVWLARTLFSAALIVASFYFEPFMTWRGQFITASVALYFWWLLFSPLHFRVGPSGIRRASLAAAKGIPLSELLAVDALWWGRIRVRSTARDLTFGWRYVEPELFQLKVEDALRRENMAVASQISG